MGHYLDIRLRPDPEFPAYQLMSALYAKLHRSLVQLGSDKIGVSFPGFDANAPHLGDCLRLHGPAAALTGLMATAWMAGVREHTEVSAILGVPTNAQHRRVFRVQAKSSPERLRRRAMRRHGIDASAARERIPDQAAEMLRLPFVQLGSRSTAQPAFLLFIQHGPFVPQPTAGKFNTYGLGHEATIPWF